MRECLLRGAVASGKYCLAPKKIHKEDMAPFLSVDIVMLACDVHYCCSHLNACLRMNPTCKHCRAKEDVREVQAKP